MKTPTPSIRLNAPHARSYRPDLPLRAEPFSSLLKTTAEDRAYYAAHPLCLAPTPETAATSMYTTDWTGARAQFSNDPTSLARRKTRLVRSAAALNIELGALTL